MIEPATASVAHENICSEDGRGFDSGYVLVYRLA